MMHGARASKSGASFGGTPGSKALNGKGSRTTFAGLHPLAKGIQLADVGSLVLMMPQSNQTTTKTAPEILSKMLQQAPEGALNFQPTVQGPGWLEKRNG